MHRFIGKSGEGAKPATKTGHEQHRHWPLQFPFGVQHDQCAKQKTGQHVCRERGPGKLPAVASRQMPDAEAADAAKATTNENVEVGLHVKIYFSGEFPKNKANSNKMKEIITRLLHLVSEVPQQIQAFSVEEMTSRPAADKWSKREILGHLCDSALHNWQRFCLAQHTDGDLRHTGYQQDILVKEDNWQGQATAEIVQLWASLNAQIVAVLKNLPKEKLPSKIVLPNGEPATLEFLIRDYLAHLEHHLAQVFSKKIEQPTLPDRWKFSTAEALEILENQAEGKLLATLLERKKMYVEIYRPDKIDHQIAHSQDEIYVIISGSGAFFNNGIRSLFAAGDLIFVPAGVEHRFEDFTDDFSTWVIFY